MFVQIDKWTSILQYGGKKMFSYKPKHRCHLSQWVEHVYVAQSWKKRWLQMWICVCPNWEINIYSKKGWKEKLFLWNQSVNVIYPNEEIEFIVPNHEKKKRLLCESKFIVIEKRSWIPNNGRKRSFFHKPNIHCHLSQWREWVYHLQ